jgi:hypothetical protein
VHDFSASCDGDCRWHSIYLRAVSTRDISLDREMGGLMTACTQPGCTGKMADGYCDVCGSPAGAAAFIPVEAAAQQLQLAEDDRPTQRIPRVQMTTQPSSTEDAAEAAGADPDERPTQLIPRVQMTPQPPSAAEAADATEADPDERPTQLIPPVQMTSQQSSTQKTADPAAADPGPAGTENVDEETVDPAAARGELSVALGLSLSLGDMERMIASIRSGTGKVDAEEGESVAVDVEPDAEAVDVEPDAEAVAAVEGESVAVDAESDAETVAAVKAESAAIDVEPDAEAVAATAEGDSVAVEAVPDAETVAAVEAESAVEAEKAVADESESVAADTEKTAAAEGDSVAVEAEKAADSAPTDPDDFDTVAADTDKAADVEADPVAANTEKAATEKADPAPTGPNDSDTVEMPPVGMVLSGGRHPLPQHPEQQVPGPVPVQDRKDKRRFGSLALVATILAALLIGALFFASRGGGDVTAQSDPAVTATATTTASKPTSEPTDESTGTGRDESPIQLEGLVDSAAPLEAVRIQGRYRGGADTFLRVQRWEDGKWLDFPLPTKTNQSGRFTTYVELGPPGRYQLRVLDPNSGVTSRTFVLVISG